MATDVFGNYICNLNFVDTPMTPVLGRVLNGSGVPANSLGSNGDLYVNTATGDVYQKSNGVWAIISGGGGGGGFNNLHGNGTPVGTQTPQYVGQIYFDDTDLLAIWRATALTNADWTQISGSA